MDRRALLGLLAAGDNVSGARLAERFGVSRAAVWKAVQGLRAMGLTIDAAAGAGYRLEGPLELLDAASIQGALSAQARRRLGTLSVLFETDSTNSEIGRLAAQAAPDLSFCCAERQSAGRGRRGRTWHSPFAANVYLSCLKRFDAGYAALLGLSLAVGVACVRALKRCGVHGVGLKWPNDLLVGDAKLGGVLVELSGESHGPGQALIGIGLNWRMPAPNGAPIDQSWTDLAQLCGARLPKRNAVVGALIESCVEALDEFTARGLSAFLDEFAQCDALQGRQVEVLAGSSRQQGTALGVDERGALRVRHEFGDRCYGSAEISVRAQ